MKKLPPYFRRFSKSASFEKFFFFENISRNRSLIKVSGDQIYEFLQGLITNDISHLKQHNNNDAIFTMFLNKQGRVLFDAIVYKFKNLDTSFFIECDRAVENQMKQHLIVFRVRKKINIDIVNDEFNIWTCFRDDRQTSECTVRSSQFPQIGGIKCDESLFSCLDPRLNRLGMRLIAPQNFGIDHFQKIFTNINTILSNETYNYHKHRYINGICEGSVEIPSTKSFPFEANCDYLHGISFHKGCYLGQEFTARTYHTGIIRKRIMPIVINSHFVPQIEYDAPIVNDKDQLVGKLKGIQNEYAIGLLKTELALCSKYLKIGSLHASTHRPMWWPIKQN